MIFKYSISFYILFNFVFPHPVDDPAIWKHYYRGSYIVNEKHDYGLGGYFRIKRTTKYTFRDLRGYLHFIKDNSYKKIRYKSSNKFQEFEVGFESASELKSGSTFYWVICNYKPWHRPSDLSLHRP